MQEDDSVTLCIPLCICWRTLAWISSEISTKLLGMPTHLDWSSLTAAGRYLMPTGHFSRPVSTPFATLHRLSPTAFSEFLCPTPDSRSPYSLPVTSKIAGSGLCLVSRQNRQGIVCLADLLHSFTLKHLIIESVLSTAKENNAPIFFSFESNMPWEAFVILRLL